jgi:AcrR family transcriptional regulator
MVDIDYMKAVRAPRDARRAILDAALEIVAEDGAGALGLRECARRAGLTHGAPYRHFESREAIVAAVAEEGFRRLHTACVEAESRAASDPLARFQALGVAYLTFALENRGHFRLMFSAEMSGDEKGVRSTEAGVFSLAVRAIVEGQRAGVIVDGDPQELAMVAWGSVHGVATLVLGGLAGWIGLGEVPVKRLAKRVTRQVFEGLAKK